MNEDDWLAERFEENRPHLRAVAYRMLGRSAEADDAVQEAWLKLSRSHASMIDNLNGWLTTVVARVCLDMLRARKSRREDSPEATTSEPAPNRESAADPEREALLAESVGLALLVVLERLEPAERLAFVLHDTFGMPFEEIAPIVGRSIPAVRQLASRARRRVRGEHDRTELDLAGHKEVVKAFIEALRSADFNGLVAVLHPAVVVQVEGPDGIREFQGASRWAKGAVAFARQAQFMEPALVNGSIGFIAALEGRLLNAARFTISDGKISRAELITAPESLAELDVAVL